MTIIRVRLIEDVPSQKVDCIPRILPYWNNSITAWQHKEMIALGIKDVYAAGLDGTYYLLKTHDASLGENKQWALDGLPGVRIRGDAFIIKFAGFVGSNYTRYLDVSTWLPDSIFAIEMLREGAVRREHIGATSSSSLSSASNDWPVWLGSDRLSQQQSRGSNERFKGSDEAEGPGFYLG